MESLDSNWTTAIPNNYFNVPGYHHFGEQRPPFLYMKAISHPTGRIPSYKTSIGVIDILIQNELSATPSSSNKFWTTLMHVVTLSISFWIMHNKQWKEDRNLVQLESGQNYTWKQYWKDSHNKFDWTAKQWENGNQMLNPRIRKPYIDKVYTRYANKKIDSQELIAFLQVFNPLISSIYERQFCIRYGAHIIAKSQYDDISTEYAKIFG